MDEEKFNLVDKKEVYEKSYEELVKMEEELRQNPEATGLDIAFVSAVVLDRELEMGIDNTIPWDEVVDELLKGTEFESNNKSRCKERLATN